MPFFLPTAFGKLSVIHDDVLEYVLAAYGPLTTADEWVVLSFTRKQGLLDDVAITIGHLYTTCLDAAKQGLRFRYGHLDPTALQDLVVARCAGRQEDQRLKQKNAASESDAYALGQLTPMQPTQSTREGAMNKSDSPKEAHRKDSSGTRRSDESGTPSSGAQTPSEGLQRSKSEDYPKPVKDEDLLALWRRVCGSTEVYAKENGTVLQRMKYFAEVRDNPVYLGTSADDPPCHCRNSSNPTEN